MWSYILKVSITEVFQCTYILCFSSVSDLFFSPKITIKHMYFVLQQANENTLTTKLISLSKEKPKASAVTFKAVIVLLNSK